MSNLVTRTIAGLIFVCILVLGILLSPISFIGLFSIISALMLLEFYQLMNKHQETSVCIPLNILGGVILFISTGLYLKGSVSSKIFLIYLIYILSIFLCELYRKKDHPIRNWAYSFLGQIYIAGPLSLLNLMAFQDHKYVSYLVLGLFVSIWLNDTGAYLVGSQIGKHRLFERISPKKSWEGFWGGIIFASLGGFTLSFFFPGLNMFQWIGLSMIIAAFSTWGDLCESLLKRTIGVKDSGKMIPGHGGMLDRFDSVLLAAPAAYIFLELI